jgi:hypothetical protein
MCIAIVLFYTLLFVRKSVGCQGDASSGDADTLHCCDRRPVSTSWVLIKEAPSIRISFLAFIWRGVRNRIYSVPRVMSRERPMIASTMIQVP